MLMTTSWYSVGYGFIWGDHLINFLSSHQTVSPMAAPQQVLCVFYSLLPPQHCMQHLAHVDI